jgi:hypothetical protein
MSSLALFKADRDLTESRLRMESGENTFGLPEVNGTCTFFLFITIVIVFLRGCAGAAKPWTRQLAAFLKKRRGTLSYAAFAKKVGFSHTTLQRLERAEHHLTLNKLETILHKLKVRLRDILPDS